MDQINSGQLYFLIITTTTLFTDIQSMGDHSFNWFHAQKQCSDHGLTIEKNQSDQPYWTGVYRRLTPWINILGCYSDSIESLQDVVKKNLITSSVGLCQEKCFYENGYKFALKMNICLCIGSNIRLNHFSGLSPSNCTYRCEDYSGDTYLRDCSGESAYNIYGIQGVIPHNSYASSWNLSMEQCRRSQASTYLLGDFDLKNPQPVCLHKQDQSQVVWVGVARQMYTGIDQGWEIEEEQRDTFLQCQICTENDCRFRRCTDSLDSSIYCNSDSGTSQSQIIENIKTSHGVFSTATLVLNRTTKQMFVSASTTANYDTDKLPPINDTLQMSGTSAELALEIALPITIVFIISLISIMTLVFYRRRKQIMKTERTTKEEIDNVLKTSVHSEVHSIQDNSYFLLEQCSKKISKGSDSLNESPYTESEEGVYDHLGGKQARKPEVEDTYQHASAGEIIDLSEYDTMANAHDKKQEEDSSYDYTHTDKNKNYRTGPPAQNHLTDNPYDVAV